MLKLDWLGYFLTPLLLISLTILIAFGLYYKGPSQSSSIDGWNNFLHGLKEGYQTMDLLGAFLLALVYAGFGLTASFQASYLEGVTQDHLIGSIARHLLGDSGGIIACAVVALACLTTAIALVAIFADFISDELGMSYTKALIITLAISFAVPTLDFTGIVKFLTPILAVIYPALIVLCLCNVGYKLFGFSWVKTPFAISLMLSLIHYLFL